MSGVYKRNRNRSKIDFYDKAVKLNDEIMDICDDTRYYSKRQTFKRAIPLMELSMEMLKVICIANDIFLRTEGNKAIIREDFIERRKYLTLAIGTTDALLQQFQRDCLKLKTIPSRRKKIVSDLAVDVMDMLKALKKSDETRYGNLI